MITDLNPNGLAFSPDEKSSTWWVEARPTQHLELRRGRRRQRLQQVEGHRAADQGALDGFRVDRDGNLWCGYGSNGALQAEATDTGGRKVFQLKGRSEDLDGVAVFNPAGKPIGFIRLPERCANLTFGGPKNNRLYMASCHSLYALYVESHGAA